MKRLNLLAKKGRADKTSFGPRVRLVPAAEVHFVPYEFLVNWAAARVISA